MLLPRPGPQDPATYDERWLPVVEDASSLAIAVARIQRLLLMDGFEFKRATALLYSLQIVAMNLKTLKAERAELESAENASKAQRTSNNGERPSGDELAARAASLAEGGEGQPKALAAGHGDEPAGLPELKQPPATASLPERAAK